MHVKMCLEAIHQRRPDKRDVTLVCTNVDDFGRGRPSTECPQTIFFVSGVRVGVRHCPPPPRPVLQYILRFGRFYARYDLYVRGWGGGVRKVSFC